MNDTGRSILIVVVVLITLPLLWGGMMMGGGMGMMGGWGPTNDWNPWGVALSTLSAVLIIGGIGAIVWWAIGGTASSSSSGRPDARDILDARYARGEITREQYQQMRGDLES